MQATTAFIDSAGYRQLLAWANLLLLLSSLVLVATVLVCYPFADWFSMPQLIAGHLSIIASATLLKISYVGRCVAQYGLQQEVR